MSDEEPFEVVLETVDSTEVVVVKSLLEAAEIPFITRGEDEYDGFRGALRADLFSSRGRPVVILVPASVAKDALALLAGDSSAEEDE
jgi:hypothetical protein